jgi:manganese/iron transport system permease protein
MMAISAFIAVFSGIVGLYLSYHLNVSSGAAIVLTCTACFGVAWLARAAKQSITNRSTGAPT